MGRAHDHLGLPPVRRGKRATSAATSAATSRSATTPTGSRPCTAPTAGAAVYTGDPADLAPEERAYRQRGAAWNATEGAYIAMQATGSPRPPRSGSPTPPPGSPRLDRGETPHLERQRRRHRAVLHQTRDPHPPHHLLAHRHHRLLHPHVPRQRPDPRRPAHPQAPGPLRLLPVLRRHPSPAQGLARTNRQPRHRLTEPPRGGHFAAFSEEPELYAEETACVLPPLPEPQHTESRAASGRRGALPRGNEVHDAADVHA